jgi:zinc transporter 1/2/3
MNIDAHGHSVGSHAAHGPEGDDQRGPEYSDRKVDDVESHQQAQNMDDDAAAQIIGVFILEFGVVLHRYDMTIE